jgi:outer membrane protein insertion porin family
MLLCAVAFLAGAPSLRAQDGYVLRDVTIIGNDSIPDDELLGVMSLTPTNWFSQNILRTTPTEFDGSVLDADIERLLRVCQSEGFLHASVAVDTLVVDDEAETVEIVLRVRQGPPVSVMAPRVTVDSAWAPAAYDTRGSSIVDSVVASVAPVLALADGRRFRDALLAADERTLTSALVDAGYPRASTGMRLDLDTAEQRVRLRWTLRPGNSAVFGPVTIEGLQRFDTSLVRERIRFAPGDRFSGHALETTRTRLLRTGVFATVRASPDLSDSLAESVPVGIDVTEAQKYRFRAGIGYGKDEKFRVTAEVSVSGVLGGPGLLTLRAKRSALVPYQFDISYLQQDVIIEDLTVAVNPYTQRQTEPGYGADRRGVRAALLYPLVYATGASLTTAFESVQRDSGSVSISSDANAVAQEFLKPSVTLSLTHTTSKPFFDPETGWYAGLALAVSPQLDSSGATYIRTLIDVRKYTHVFPASVLAAKLKLGVVQPLTSGTAVPVEERFFAGGGSSVRGWPYALLGPLGEDGKPLGGQSLLEAGLEWRQLLAGQFSVALFTDAGNAWLEPRTWRLNEIVLTTGAGARYNTPIGPVRFDVARPVFNDRTEWEIYLSVGHAF